MKDKNVSNNLSLLQYKPTSQSNEKESDANKNLPKYNLKKLQPIVILPFCQMLLPLLLKWFFHTSHTPVALTERRIFPWLNFFDREAFTVITPSFACYYIPVHKSVSCYSLLQED